VVPLLSLSQKTQDPKKQKNMKNIITIYAFVGLAILSVLVAACTPDPPKNQAEQPKKSEIKSEIKEATNQAELQNGDLIFQTSLSSQSKAIQLATKSKYSHCGIIYKEGNDFFVFEAVQPVKRTPLAKWIARGQNGKYVVKRLKNADEVLTPAVLAKMKTIGNQFVGKNYDLTFEWSDDKIYCSELIWKIYQRATGISIGALQKLGDFDLSNEIVKNKMKERYGNNIPNEEIVVSPAAIYDSPLLTTIKAN
jgi:uncharacterized protein YycO